MAPQPGAPQAAVADAQLAEPAPVEAPSPGAVATTTSDVPAASVPVAAVALSGPASPAPAVPAAAAPSAAPDTAATALPAVTAATSEDAKGKIQATTEEEVAAESLTAALFGARAPEAGKGRTEAQPGAKRPSAAEQTGAPAEAAAPGDSVRPAAGAVPHALPRMPDAAPEMPPEAGATAMAVKGADAVPVATRQDAPASAQPSPLAAAAPVVPASAPQPATAATYAAPFRSYVQAPPAAQVAPAVVSVAARGGIGGAPSRLVVAIHPAELGQVEVAVEQVVDGVPQVRILAERPETLIMLQRDRSAIEAALRQAGMAEGAASSLSFGLSENAQGGGKRQETHRRSAGGRAGDVSEGVASLNNAIATARTAPRGLLDLAL
jgi:hypothetical protein